MKGLKLMAHTTQSEQSKIAERHYWHAKEALESLMSACSELGECDPAVAYQWDYLMDIKSEALALRQKVSQLTRNYAEEIKK